MPLPITYLQSILHPDEEIDILKEMENERASAEQNKASSETTGEKQKSKSKSKRIRQADSKVIGGSEK